jgi:hypothetical protein
VRVSFEREPDAGMPEAIRDHFRADVAPNQHRRMGVAKSVKVQVRHDHAFLQVRVLEQQPRHGVRGQARGLIDQFGILSALNDHTGLNLFEYWAQVRVIRDRANLGRKHKVHVRPSLLGVVAFFGLAFPVLLEDGDGIR